MKKKKTTKAQSVAHLRKLRALSIAGSFLAGLFFLFFNAATIIGPHWYLLLGNAIPFALMIGLGICAIRIDRIIRNIVTPSTEQNGAE